MDKQLEKIHQELEADKDPKLGGRPIKLSAETFITIISSLQNGLDREEACRTAQIDKTAFYRYMKKSEEFRNAVVRAEDFPNAMAAKAVVQDFMGMPERKIVQLDNMGNKVDVTLPAIPGNVESAKWWLERRRKDRFSKNPDVVGANALLGAPKNEKELGLMKKLMDGYARANARNSKE